MILIVSHQYDISTRQVIDWLIRYKKNFVLINDEDQLVVKRVEVGGEVVLELNGSEISFNNLSSVWFRKGDLSINTHPVPDRVLFHKSINKFLTVENEFLRKHFYSILLTSSALGNFLNTDVNKIDVLLAAKEVGILIPPTLITARKSELISFIDENREIITKPISGAASFLENNISMSSYTEVVPEQLIKSLPDQFPVGLFQKKLEKKYEVRVFYLNGRFYSMAIFSQLDEQTQIDFRRYNYARPNRTVPYKLNSELCEKLHLLMMQLKLNTGSFDLVVDVEDTIYFLEVNPVGQFGMVSYPCNYNLEREVALFLSNEK